MQWIELENRNILALGQGTILDEIELKNQAAIVVIVEQGAAAFPVFKSNNPDHIRGAWIMLKAQIKAGANLVTLPELQ